MRRITQFACLLFLSACVKEQEEIITIDIRSERLRHSTVTLQSSSQPAKVKVAYYCYNATTDSNELINKELVLGPQSTVVADGAVKVRVKVQQRVFKDSRKVLKNFYKPLTWEEEDKARYLKIANLSNEYITCGIYEPDKPLNGENAVCLEQISPFHTAYFSRYFCRELE